MVPIALDGKPVYGVIEADGVGLRVRLSVDEFARLGLVPGRQVRVGAGECPGTYLLTAVDPAPPVAWLRLLPLSSRIAGRAEHTNGGPRLAGASGAVRGGVERGRVAG